MSSSSKRQRNERFTSQRETAKAKEVPHAGLVMLKADGSNQVAWTSALNNHLEATWGTFGVAVVAGNVIVRAVPDLDRIQADFPALTPGNVQKQYLDEVSEYKKQLKKDAESRSSIYALMRQVTSEDGLGCPEFKTWPGMQRSTRIVTPAPCSP